MVSGDILIAIHYKVMAFFISHFGNLSFMCIPTEKKIKLNRFQIAQSH